MNETSTALFPIDDPHHQHMTVLSVSYQGQSFYGIQSQPQVRTVMGVLQHAVEQVVDHTVDLLIAGRTDRGVHATHQIVAFPSSVIRPDRAYLEGVNNLLSQDVRIDAVTHVPRDFHPRFNALSRTYTYLMYKGRYLPAHWVERAYALDRRIDVARMLEASRVLIGHHDFSAFRAAGCQSLSPYREVYSLTFSETPLWIMVRITANAFLYRMVRKIVQSLLYAGSGMWQPHQIEELLHSKNSTKISLVPSYGLYLTNIVYPDVVSTVNKNTLCWLDRMYEEGDNA